VDVQGPEAQRAALVGRERAEFLGRELGDAQAETAGIGPGTRSIGCPVCVETRLVSPACCWGGSRRPV
jgi:hypothetical protein